jgi:hypothetical protein
VMEVGRQPIPEPTRGTAPVNQDDGHDGKAPQMVGTAPETSAAAAAPASFRDISLGSAG